jgi:hypothetical protein
LEDSLTGLLAPPWNGGLKETDKQALEPVSTGMTDAANLPASFATEDK